jgi:hypothetical protein
VRALRDVVGVELPLLVRLVEPSEEALLLLVPRDVEEALDDLRPAAVEVALEGVDVLVALLPDPAGLRNPLSFEPLGMHAHREHLLVVRAIEDADAAALGRARRHAPEEVVVELLDGTAA